MGYVTLESAWVDMPSKYRETFLERSMPSVSVMQAMSAYCFFKLATSERR